MPAPTPLETIEREVWTTPEEFRHGLELAFPGRVAEHDGVLRVDGGEVAMEIELRSMTPRTIALLNLPRLKVSIRMTAGTLEQRAAMLTRMDLAMHRGGG
ncbi:MAG: hypothetical protein KJ634_13695 [Gammaproteobacteria bacterium]|nr:hypothetical protein [Gammaproteobacteria bacterium]MBU1416670.1 hypothetical protein [Gammaproteobacteria bacterium]